MWFDMLNSVLYKKFLYIKIVKLIYLTELIFNILSVIIYLPNNILMFSISLASLPIIVFNTPILSSTVSYKTNISINTQNNSLYKSSSKNNVIILFMPLYYRR